MGLHASCSSCGKQYRVKNPAMVGRTVRCKCGEPMQVLRSAANPNPQNSLETNQPLAVDENLSANQKDAGNPLAPTHPRPQQSPDCQPTNSNSFGVFEVICIVVGVFAAFQGLLGIWGMFSSVMSLANISSFNESVEELGTQGAEVPSFTGYLVVAAMLGMIGSVVAICLGICGIALIAYIMELRTKGKSTFQWSLPGGAAAGSRRSINLPVIYFPHCVGDDVFLDGFLFRSRGRSNNGLNGWRSLSCVELFLAFFWVHRSSCNDIGVCQSSSTGRVRHLQRIRPNAFRQYENAEIPSAAIAANSVGRLSS